MPDEGENAAGGKSAQSPDSSRRASTSSNNNTPTGQHGGQSLSSSAHFGTASQMSETVRRNRPVALQSRTEYGSINTNPRPYTLTATEGPATKGGKRPGPGRRSTSTHIPRKGQEFSVDDETDEIDLDLKTQRPPYDKSGRRSQVATGTLRRQASTLRRRPTAPPLAKIDSASGDEEEEEEEAPKAQPESDITMVESEEQASPEDNDGAPQVDGSGEAGDDDDVDDLSDAESFTLKDRQEAINETHPFGIRIWKPALYKKDRSVAKAAEEDVHSSPGGSVSAWLLSFNFLWTVIFGWWLALIAMTGAIVCVVVSFASDSSMAYAVLLSGLAKYLLNPFGKYVKLLQDETYAEEDEGEGRSITEYEQWQSGDLEEGRLFFGPTGMSRSLIGRRRNSVDSNDDTQSLLGRTRRGLTDGNNTAGAKRRLFGRGEWNVGRVVFFIFFYGLLTPSLLIVSGICWLFIFSIPMGKVTLLLFDHLRRHPLALSFHSDKHDTRNPGEAPSSVLVCTYRAVGWRYWKYTIDGTNIFLFNLLAIVAFTIFDYWVLAQALGLNSGIANQGFIFALALFSIIPLAYFIGQAVASISAQSSMGVGATINAFFSTVVEVFLYCVALNEGKHQLVEGSIIGSIFAGILFLPGLSMCFGALKRKTQRFNVKSAGVTSTMMLFAIIGAFSPTLFYQIYGSHELKCTECNPEDMRSSDRDCRRCFFSQLPAVNDRFYQEAVLPYIWFSATTLFLAYVIGLLFTLRTHAAVIWSTELDEKKHGTETMAASHVTAAQPAESRDRDQFAALTRTITSGSLDRRADIRESQLYQRILRQTSSALPNGGNEINVPKSRPADVQTPHSMRSPHIVPPKDRDEGNIPPGFHLQSLSEEDNRHLTGYVAEMAATAAAVAARDATRAPRIARKLSATPIKPQHIPATGGGDHPEMNVASGASQLGVQPAAGGHDAPNWSRMKSAVILLTATLAYAIIAEILVSTVDSILVGSNIDEKFLGITLFALVPNTTEFLNAISFAMNGNIALSMEIGSAYALQVCLLQIPALVLYSAVHGRFINPEDVFDHTFTLIFEEWDLVTIILCVFLLSYMYGEGKSNYFKGSILILAYLVVLVGSYFSSFNNKQEGVFGGVNPMDTLALGRGSFRQMKKTGFVDTMPRR
ncbi:hypothetical protein EJ08DRAFT_701522 [Tothia fuscella]|uniref:Calcium permease family membrane transporter n=1 Tax=Tothia fuscella TaxID=1048955 RepID=A0A9P4TTJ3_9PEZI|nr:hypothetical protein EJ08DRAFT_701522 [Tothia fuscella]